MRRAPVRLGAALLLAAPAAAAAQAARNAAPNTAPNAAAQEAAPSFDPKPAAGRPSLRGWTTDRRDFAVGDILTVFVDDYTISTAVKDDLNAQRRSRDLSLRVDKPNGPGISAGLGSRNNADAQNRGEARRENRFQSELSVRVVAAGPNGTYQVRGTRLVDVDKAQQQVTLTGWVRAQDVTPANTVESSRLADAQIAYLSPGPLGKPKQGLVTRVVSLLWP